MGKEHPVITLIRSLDENERKFVGRWLQRWRKNTYVSDLYKFILRNISKQPIPIQEFKKKHPTCNISIANNTLYANIMEALAHLYPRQLKEYELLQNIINSSVLIDKGLYEESYSLLMTTIEIARQIGYHGIVIYALHLLLRLLRRWQNNNLQFENFATIGLDVINDFQHWLTYAINFDRLLNKYQAEGGRLNEKNIRGTINPKQPSSNASLLTKYLYIQNVLIGQGLKDNYSKGIETAYQLIDTLLQNPSLLPSTAHLISSITVNLIIHLTETKDIDSAELFLKKILEMLNVKMPLTELNELRRSYVLAQLYFSDMTGRAPLHFDFSKLLREVVNTLPNTSWDFAYIHFTMAKLLFYQGNWDNAINWLKPFLTHGKGNTLRNNFKDLAGFAYLLAALISYEQGKIDNIHTFSRRAKYLLQKQPYYKPILNQIINILMRLTFHELTNKDWSELNTLLLDPKAQDIIRYIDLRRWQRLKK